MKKEYLILIAVILGLVAYLFLKDNNQTHFQLPETPAMDSAKTDHIRITRGKRTIELVRRDDKWFIEPRNYPADGVKVKNMLKAASDLKLTALVSESGNYERYDLSDDKKTDVRLLTGSDVQREFEIGRTAPTYQHTFVKLPGDADVYYAKGSLEKTFDVDLANLRDKIVMTFDPSTITALDLKKGGHVLNLAKKEVPLEEKTAQGEKDKTASAQPQKPKSVWQSSDGQTVDQAAVERLLSSFSRLQCDGFAEGASKAEFKDPAWQLTFKNDQGTHTFAVQAKKAETDNQVEAISSSSDYVFMLMQTRAEGLERHVDKLLGIEAPKKK